MKYYVGINVAVVGERMAAVGIPVTVAPAFMIAEKTFSVALKKPVQLTSWTGKQEHATGFLSEEDAWAAFDRSGHGRRSDYEVIS